ncbi:NAD(P)-binding protein [Aspergillus karnatakaensis]|uniref:NAD(P)-binding protein n=1 Tax=Aspergillus karnatakaensis TaxID=1810916 RepID=UPI003CCE198F
MKIANPAIPRDSTVVVLGANGYIAQETIHKLLEVGYRVRGTVRDLERNAWVDKLFNDEFPGKFELAQVVDFTAEGAFDEAFRDATGVIYVSVPIALSPDPAVAIDPIVKGVLNTLNAACKFPTIKRFVLNSSSKAVESTVFNHPHKLTKETFNRVEIDKARNEPTVLTPERVGTAYSAGRAASELAFWDWVEEHKGRVGFVANAVVPDANFGRVLDAEHTGTGPATSVGMLERALKGSKEGVLPWVGYLIDTQDTARLLVAALALPTIANERIFAFNLHYVWNDLRAKVRELYPKRKDLVLGEDYEDIGRDIGDASEPIARAEEILREVGQDGYTSLDGILRDYVESFYLKRL